MMMRVVVCLLGDERSRAAKLLGVGRPGGCVDRKARLCGELAAAIVFTTLLISISIACATTMEHMYVQVYLTAFSTASDWLAICYYGG